MKKHLKKPLKSVLIKPAGPDCNLRCTYCFYLRKTSMFPKTKKHAMTQETMRAVVRKALEAESEDIYFGWQGGEPTLMGLDFFRKVVEAQMEYGKGQTVCNGLQTNGLLIDDDWIDFLDQYKFLVGISLDGPQHIHDKYRKFAEGTGSWEKVFDSARRMLDGRIAVNALCVVNDYSVRFPDEIYSFFKEAGLRHMQFIPCVEKNQANPSKMADYSVPANKYGDFLCRLFDLWCADFESESSRGSIRFFDSILLSYLGTNPADCTMQPSCGNYLLVEHNGDVFPCDFYVEHSMKLGNVSRDNLLEMLNSKAQRNFGLKKANIHSMCNSCQWLKLCRGGCPRERLVGGKDLSNHLCSAYRKFFEHSSGRFTSLSDQVRKQTPLT